ncbi:MAG TPA: HAMP domain-containing sensor histidine kinase [Fibrobacteria bacterium]|nr:HAMP domain-containing sensor histidine kinase [Fibrobacteria bacterium]HOX51435.1 HAMP domain-containing sensor histidine kinase [Fibrobacteria bacterium]
MVRSRTWVTIAGSGLATLLLVVAVYFQQRAVLIESHLLAQDRLLQEIEGTFRQLMGRQMRTGQVMAHVVRNSGEGSAQRQRAWSILATDSAFGHLALVGKSKARLLWGRGDHQPWLGREFFPDAANMEVSDLEAPPAGRDSSWDAGLSVRIPQVEPGSDLELAATGSSLARTVEPFLVNRGVSLALVNSQGMWFPMYDRDSGLQAPRRFRELSDGVFRVLQGDPRGILWRGQQPDDPVPPGTLVHARTIAVWGGVKWIMVLHVPRREITAPLIAQFGRTGALLSILAAMWLALTWMMVRRDFRLARLEADLEYLRELRRKDEQLLQAEKLATVGVLVSGLAHEIGTPLGVVAMRLQLMRRRTAQDGEDRKTLDVALSQLDRVTGLIRHLLDFARSKPAPEQAVDLVAIAGSVSDLVEPLARKRSAMLSVENPQGVPKVSGTPDGVQQIILNLVMNALQAIDDGGKVVVGILPEGAWVKLLVEDDGPGIPEDRRAAIFDPFYTTKKQGEGSGLGLTVVLGLVRRMGAELAVNQSELGGARFAVRFRVHGDPAVADKTEPAAAP